MLKKHFHFFIFLSIYMIFFKTPSFLFAYSGLMAESDKVMTLSTKWFDIIYAAESEESAVRLSECCDSIYEELCKTYNVPSNLGQDEGLPQFRIPVTISNGTDVFNAYFSNGNFNHIVLYDTLPDQDMAVFSDSLIGTFTHELTHAVSINMRNDSMRSLADMFSDGVNFASILVMPSLIKEGAGVEYESLKGEGRLNDGFYLHTLRQAKLSGSFPSYADVTGARSKYPSASASYSFGGPFVEYLIKEYSREVFNNFWYNAVNLKGLTFKRVFNKTYPVSLNKAWKDFENQIKVPDIKKEPLEEKNIKDFFSDSSKLSLKNKRASLYSNLTSFKGGVIFSDDSSSSVYISYKKENSFSKVKKLFSLKNINSLKASLDGRFLALSYINLNQVNLKNKIKVFDIQKNKWIEIKENLLSEACVLKKEDGYYLAAVKKSGQNSFLCIYKLNKDESSFDFVKEISFEKSAQIFSPVQMSDSSLAFIYKKGLSWSIVRSFNFLEDALFFEKVSLAENVRIQNLNPDPFSNTISFSYAKKDTFPRAAFASFSNDFNNSEVNFYFEKADTSGGIYFPLVWNFSENKNFIVYKASFYDNTALLIKENLLLNRHTSLLKPFDLNKKEESKDKEKIVNKALPYKKLFWHRGSFYLLSDLQAMTFSSDLKNMNSDGIENKAFEAGFTLEKSNPWDSAFFTFSAGLDLLNLSGGFNFSFSGQSETSLYQYKNTSSFIFDSKGLNQISNSFYFASSFYISKSFAFVIEESNKTFLGRGELYSKLKDASDSEYSVDLNNYIYTLNDASFYFTNIQKKGSATYESSGFALGAGLKNTAIKNLDGTEPDYISSISYNNFYPFTQIYLSKLIPVSCVNNFTYNLPLRIYASLLSSRNTFFYLNAESLIFSYEIQKGFATIPLYFNRILFTSGYKAQLQNDNRDFEIIYLIEDFKNTESMDFNDSVYAAFFIQSGLNTGALANPALSVKVGLQTEYYLRGSNKGKFSLSLTMSTLF